MTNRLEPEEEKIMETNIIKDAWNLYRLKKEIDENTITDKKYFWTKIKIKKSKTE